MTKIEQKIPEGWSVKKLGDICDVRDGTHTSPKFFDRGFPLITSKNLINGKIDFKNIQYISKKDHIEICKRSNVDDGDILLAMIGTIGNPVLVKKDREFSIKNVALFKVGKNNNHLNNVYLYNYLSYSTYELNKKSAGGTQKFVGLSEFRKFQLPIPPLPEQEKIAGILSCWDDGIEKLSALIEKKKIQKKALMQQLLTGKHRLKGFSTPWHEVKLGDVFSIKKGQGLSKEELNPLGKNACILYGELYTTYNEVIYNIKSLTNVDSGITSQVGDILIPASTTTTGIDLANATALMVSGVLLGGDINILRCKIQSSPIFFAYLLTHIYKYDIAKLAQGMTIVHLYGEFIKKIKVFIPSDLAEQKAIAEILSKADEEIELLNKKLEAFKQEKKALMQQLLTGKIRVKVN